MIWMAISIITIRTPIWKSVIVLLQVWILNRSYLAWVIAIYHARCIIPRSRGGIIMIDSVIHVIIVIVCVLITMLILCNYREIHLS